MSDENLQQAIAAIKAGDKEHAKQLFSQILEVDDNNEDAWLGMALCIDGSQLKRECLQRALEINPNSELAKRGLRRLDTLGKVKSSPSAKKRRKKAKKKSPPTQSMEYRMKKNAMSIGVIIGAIVGFILPFGLGYRIDEKAVSYSTLAFAFVGGGIVLFLRSTRQQNTIPASKRNIAPWLVVGLLFILPYAISAVKGPSLESTPKPLPPADTPTPAPTIDGIGISRSEIQSVFASPEIGFTFESSSDVKNQPRVMGTSANELAVLELIGPPDDLLEASILVGVPVDNQEAMIENSIYMLGLLVLAVPDWEDAPDWMTENLSTLTEVEEATTIYENSVITLRAYKELGFVGLTVKSVGWE